MRCSAMLVALLLPVSASDALGQSGSREDRVVVYSPHFDIPRPLWGPSNPCPSDPLSLFGFEAAAEPDGVAPLSVRLLHRQSNTRAAAIAGASVSVTHRVDDGARVPLQSAIRVDADSSGLALVRVPPGVYLMRFVAIGYATGGAGIIRVRGIPGDSVVAYLDVAWLCY